MGLFHTSLALSEVEESDEDLEVIDRKKRERIFQRDLLNALYDSNQHVVLNFLPNTH